MREFPELEKGMIVYRPKGIWSAGFYNNKRFREDMPCGRILSVTNRDDGYGNKDAKNVVVDFGPVDGVQYLTEWDFTKEEGVLISTFGGKYL